jgi:hypothetical protein
MKVEYRYHEKYYNYLIGNDGSVFSCMRLGNDNNKGTRFYGGHFLKASPNFCGYSAVGIVLNDKFKTVIVHRIAREALVRLNYIEAANLSIGDAEDLRNAKDILMGLMR